MGNITQQVYKELLGQSDFPGSPKHHFNVNAGRCSDLPKHRRLGTFAAGRVGLVT